MYDMLRNISYKSTHNDQEMNELGELRYTAFLDEGAIKPNNSLKLIDEYDGEENSVNISVYYDNLLIGGIRLHVLNPRLRKSPSCTVFADYVNPFLDSGATILEIMRFFLNPNQKKQLFGFQFAVLRAAVIATEFYNADYMIAPVRREHFAFYRKFGSFIPVCDPKPFPTLCKPVGLVIGDVKQDKDAVLSKYPFFCSDFIKKQNITYPKIDSADWSGR